MYFSNAVSMNQTLKKVKNMISTTTKEQIKAQKTIEMNKQASKLKNKAMCSMIIYSFAKKL